MCWCAVKKLLTHSLTSLCYLSTIKTSIHVLMAESNKYYLAQGGILGVSVAQGTTYRVGILEAHKWQSRKTYTYLYVQWLVCEFIMQTQWQFWGGAEGLPPIVWKLWPQTAPSEIYDADMLSVIDHLGWKCVFRHMPTNFFSADRSPPP